MDEAGPGLHILFLRGTLSFLVLFPAQRLVLIFKALFSFRAAFADFVFSLDIAVFPEPSAHSPFPALTDNDHFRFFPLFFYLPDDNGFEIYNLDHVVARFARVSNRHARQPAFIIEDDVSVANFSVQADLDFSSLPAKVCQGLSKILFKTIGLMAGKQFDSGLNLFQAVKCAFSQIGVDNRNICLCAAQEYHHIQSV